MIDNKYFVSLGPPLNITDVRLANGTGPYDGRAEIKVGNQWGTICNTNFDIIDADAFCRRLGLRQAAKSSMIYDSPLWRRHSVFALSVWLSIRLSHCFRSIAGVPFDAENSNFTWRLLVLS